MIKLLDDVALLEDLPEHDLQRGQVRTVVEELAPGIFEVEFSDSEGRTYALLARFCSSHDPTSSTPPFPVRLEIISLHYLTDAISMFLTLLSAPEPIGWRGARGEVNRRASAIRPV